MSTAIAMSCLLLIFSILAVEVAVDKAYSYVYSYCYFWQKIDVAVDIATAVNIAIEEKFQFAHFCKFFYIFCNAKALYQLKIVIWAAIIAKKCKFHAKIQFLPKR